MRSTLIAMTALVIALGGCNRPDANHAKDDYTSSLLSRMSSAEINAATVPPAPPERGPIPPSANAADPATDASLASLGTPSVVPDPGSDNSPEGQHLAVMAEDAAARAPDTASADEAKRKVYGDAARGGGERQASTTQAQQESSGEAGLADAKSAPSSESMTAQPNASLSSTTSEKS